MGIHLLLSHVDFPVEQLLTHRMVWPSEKSNQGALQVSYLCKVSPVKCVSQCTGESFAICTAPGVAEDFNDKATLHPSLLKPLDFCLRIQPRENGKFHVTVIFGACFSYSSEQTVRALSDEPSCRYKWRIFPCASKSTNSFWPQFMCLPINIPTHILYFSVGRDGKTQKGH